MFPCFHFRFFLSSILFSSIFFPPSYLFLLLLRFASSLFICHVVVISIYFSVHVHVSFPWVLWEMSPLNSKSQAPSLPPPKNPQLLVAASQRFPSRLLHTDVSKSENVLEDIPPDPLYSEYFCSKLIYPSHLKMQVFPIRYFSR